MLSLRSVNALLICAVAKYFNTLRDITRTSNTAAKHVEFENDGKQRPATLVEPLNHVDCRGPHLTNLTNSRRNHDLAIRALKRYQQFRCGPPIAI